MLRSIKEITKRTMNAVLPAALQYRQGDRRNILLFASRRGGSTYLAGLVAREPGMRYVDDPFNLTDFDMRRRQVREAHLPHLPYSQFISLADSEARMVSQYLSRLLNGGLSELDAYGPPKNRTIIKILNASTLVDWCAQRFDVFTIYLARHPIPQALSVLRNNWPLTAEAYLSDPMFSSKYLSARQRHTGRRIMETGTPLDKAVLNWVLESFFALKYATKIDLTLTYEELVLYPARMLNLVAETVDLENIAGMLRRVNTPSWSSQFNDRGTSRAIELADTGFLIRKWVSKLEHLTMQTIGEILSAFDVSEYSAADPLPTEKLCHFLRKPPEPAGHP